MFTKMKKVGCEYVVCNIRLLSSSSIEHLEIAVAGRIAQKYNIFRLFKGFGILFFFPNFSFKEFLQVFLHG